MVPMAMSPEDVQRTMLTPKMLLSMHVLQLNITDLRTFVRAEVEENPLLEEEEIIEKHPDGDKVELDEELSRLIDEDIKGEAPLLANYEVYTISEEKRRYLESLITKKESLYEHLHWQLEVLAEDDEQRRIGEFIIGNLDDNGFLNMELEKMREEIIPDI